jgi:hypothetical protein
LAKAQVSYRRFLRRRLRNVIFMGSTTTSIVLAILVASYQQDGEHGKGGEYQQA